MIEQRGVNVLLVSDDSNVPDFSCRRYIGKKDFPKIQFQSAGNGYFDFLQSNVKAKLTVFDRIEIHKDLYSQAKVVHHPSGDLIFRGQVNDWEVDESGLVPVISFGVDSEAAILKKTKFGDYDSEADKYSWAATENESTGDIIPQKKTIGQLIDALMNYDSLLGTNLDIEFELSSDHTTPFTGLKPVVNIYEDEEGHTQTDITWVYVNTPPLDLEFPMGYINASFADALKDIALLTNTYVFVLSGPNGIDVKLKSRNLNEEGTKSKTLERRMILKKEQDQYDRKDEEIPELKGIANKENITKFGLNPFYSAVLNGNFIGTELEILNHRSPNPNDPKFFQPWDWIKDDRGKNYGYIRSIKPGRHVTKIKMERVLA